MFCKGGWMSIQSKNQQQSTDPRSPVHFNTNVTSVQNAFLPDTRGLRNKFPPTPSFMLESTKLFESHGLALRNEAVVE